MVKREFLTNDQGVKAICLYYGGQDHWRKCYNDIWKWKKIDPAFAEAYESYKIKMNKPNTAGGRKKLSEQDPDWQDKFCEAFIKFRNLKKAASVTPYSFNSIMRMTDPNDSSFDQEFTTKLKLARWELSADLEQIAMDTAYTAGEGMTRLSVDDIKILEGISRITLNTLSKTNAERFGKKLEMQVTGKIDHTHSIGGRTNALAELMQEQRTFLKGKGVNFPLALPEPDEDILEADFVELKKDAIPR